MLKKLSKENMGTSNLDWLESRFHFSFAEYRNPNNLNFGVLRVLNDDIIHPKNGFDMHPHRDMEIISYVVEGELTHRDSMGNSETLGCHNVQYMSAGTGVTHSEYNLSHINDLRLLQIWILPPEKNLVPIYGSYKYQENEFNNKLLNIVSSKHGNSKIQINQDINIYASKLDAKNNLKFDMLNHRQVYFVQIEGASDVNGIKLNDGDALEIINEVNITISALTKSHILFIEMKK